MDLTLSERLGAYREILAKPAVGDEKRKHTFRFRGTDLKKFCECLRAANGVFKDWVKPSNNEV